ncbi:SDR family NAD(P)-dependent oxidoreductase [Legionella sp. W05-934-2]|uniref:SDR family NAD(P)-dependent oxidoreductase n=1 Tax=Legionella sp. W05-934-2 TaxID=1198649 RepID=UPI003463003A
MKISFKNRVALISGSSQGIGKAIAKKFAAAGANLILTSNDKKTLEIAQQEISSYGTRVISIYGDLRQEKHIDKVVKDALTQFGKVDFLINNVGSIGRISPFEDIAPDEWYELFSLNVMSGIHFSRKLLPSMKENGFGKILFISSEKAIEPGVLMTHYAMTKSAQLSITKSLANEYGKYGISVNSISPGVIVTPSWYEEAHKNNLSPEDYARQFCNNVFDSQALGAPEDVAELAYFLCSDSARWITGSNFRIDGGSVKSIGI